MDNNQHDEKRVAQDLETIKTILMSVDEQPLIDNWAFFTWGLFFLAGSLATWILNNIMAMPMETIMVPVWLTVFAAGSFFETIAMMGRVTRDSISIYSRNMMKIYLSLLVGMFGVVILLYIVYQASGMTHLPAAILVSMGIVMSLYAQLAYFHLYYWSAATILGGMILYSMSLFLPVQTIAAGCIMGFAFIGSGVQSILHERSRGNE